MFFARTSFKKFLLFIEYRLFSLIVSTFHQFFQELLFSMILTFWRTFNSHLIFNSNYGLRVTIFTFLSKFPNQVICIFSHGCSEVVTWRCSVKKLFLEISQNSQENTCAIVAFLIKLHTSGLQLY